MTEHEEQNLDSLARAREGQSLGNYPAIFTGFMDKGIPEADIKPRENVFTFGAWKALGRVVKKGEHGVRVVTIKRWKDKKGEDQSRPGSSTVFHISQTKLIDAPDDERETSAEASREFAPAPADDVAMVEQVEAGIAEVAKGLTCPVCKHPHLISMDSGPCHCGCKIAKVM